MIVTSFPIRYEIYCQLPGPMHHSADKFEGRLIPVS
ncbi:hypothetical protein SAMN04489752_1606 [Brevibacterium siliguriense]|uniref:Uncharacterized protein n=1 Tax=Brevibacterium siliguriense TaxID=1136497 RepID=A0A1H1RSG5_9MICO|nr:hypothetical protein SAMN04489752_1606 [Brevibacterium siliguriense]